VIALPEFTAGIWGVDNGAVILAVAPLVEDRRFPRLVEPRVHTAVLRTVPQLAPWLDVLEPTSPVHPMGGLRNSFRRPLADGRPLATGLFGVGDSVCTTNPTYGRGLALALVGAAELADVLARDLSPLDAAAYDERFRVRVEPYYWDQAQNDCARLDAVRRAIAGQPGPPLPSGQPQPGQAPGRPA
jgi:2-polyprenyl-6-methoxyphenol hydroxylase-like FAD-dependent oxidoreductase